MANFAATLRLGPAAAYSRYWLATLARAAYYPTSFAVQDQLSAATDADWLPGGKGLESPALPSWVSWTLGPDTALLAVAGTVLLETWYHHVAGAAQTGSGPWPGRANSFFTAGALGLAAAAAASVGPLPPGGRWLLVGHSWGGALVQLLPFVLAASYPGVTFQAVTFGAPKVGDAAFAAAVEALASAFYLSNEQNGSDPIPQLPPRSSFLLSGTALGSALSFLGSYEPAGAARRWVPAVGPSQVGAPVPAIVDATGALNAVYGGASGQVRSHKMYYYCRGCWQRAYGGLGQEAAQERAAAHGYSLGAIDGANARLDQLDGLTTNPLWPAPPAQEP